MKVILAVLAFVASATALCPNSCSGHGSCGTKDACTCDPNFIGADCSQRVCPYGIAFVDTPVGDLDHSGAVTSTGVKVQFANTNVNEKWPGAAAEEAHFYSECSGKGLCNRGSGECECFDGYTGSACQRTTCPNDCSGHGRCRTLSEIASNRLTQSRTRSEGGTNFFSGMTTTQYTYNLWDADKNQACVCDAGYIGADCSQRECPRGDDPLTDGTRYCGNEACEYAVVTFDLTAAASSTLKFGFEGWDGLTNYAYATVVTNTDSPTSSPTGTNLDGPTTTAGKILAALRGMPGGALKKVAVSCRATGSGGTGDCTSTNTQTYDVTFTDVPGLLNLLTVTVESGAVSVSSAPAFYNSKDGNREEITCSGRGLCDYDTGLCGCFSGYYGAKCEHQNALVTGGAAAAAPAAAASA